MKQDQDRIPQMTIDRDNQTLRLERIEHIREELRVKVEGLHALATLAQHRADRRVADTKTITNRAFHRKRNPTRKR